IHGGNAKNSVADKVRIEGTIRTTSTDVRKQIKDRFISEVMNVIKASRSDTEINYIEGHTNVINDKLNTDMLEKSVSELISGSNIYDLGKPSLGADDFGYFSEKIPSTYFRLGIVEEDKPIYDLHHPKFYFRSEEHTSELQSRFDLV